MNRFKKWFGQGLGHRGPIRGTIGPTTTLVKHTAQGYGPVLKDKDLPLPPTLASENLDSCNLKPEITPWDDDATIRTYVNSIDRELLSQAIAGYGSFANLTLDWWRGRVETQKFVEITARTLASRPTLLQNLNILLNFDSSHSARVFVSPASDKEVAVVVLDAPSGSQILPVSKAAKSRAGRIRSSKDVQALLAQDDPLKTLVNLKLDPLWAPPVMQLFQLELEKGLDEEYCRKCMKCLRTLVKTYRALPPSFLLDDLVREGNNPIWGGGFADIWKGRLANQVVCMKVLRIFTGSDDREKLINAFCHEALVWKQLQHPNVLPFLGVNMELFSPSFCLVSPWMPNRDIITFLKQNPLHDRLHVFLEIAEGLDYLHSHSPPIIHGDVRGANILVNNELHCCLADFGLAIVTETQGLVTTTGALRGSTRWLAPEVMSPGRFPKCHKSARDIYAFGCTMLEIITETPPFSEHKMDVAVIHDVVNGVRPPRPTGDGVWCPDKVWDLIESCWMEDGYSRPPACSIPRFLKGIARDSALDSSAPLLHLTPRQKLKPRRSALFSYSPYDGGSEYTGSDGTISISSASASLRSQQSALLVRRRRLGQSQFRSKPYQRVPAKATTGKKNPPPRIVITAASSSEENESEDDITPLPLENSVIVPETPSVILEVKAISKPSVYYRLGECVGVGTSSSVYQAIPLDEDSELVAVKQIYLGQMTVSDSIRFMEEIQSLISLSHPNIIKYEGLARTDAMLWIALEYVDGRSLRHLVQEFGPLHSHVSSRYISQALEGLNFLHSHNIVHFDVKAANILLTNSGGVKLSDFGAPFSWIPNMAQPKEAIGSPNWLAPEVIELNGPTEKSDIWAVGCTVVELITGKPPYDEIANTFSVMFRVVEDKNPPIPKGCSAQLESFLLECFRRDPLQRPSAEDLLDHPWIQWDAIATELEDRPFTRTTRALSVADFVELDEAISQQDMQTIWSTKNLKRDDDAHEYMKTTFSRPLKCRLCGGIIVRSAICCRKCPLIAHPSCAVQYDACTQPFDSLRRR